MEDLSEFKERLNSDGFKNIGGARKSITKSHMPEADKDKARTLAEKHFGESGHTVAAAPKRAAKKAAKKEGTRGPGRPPKVKPNFVPGGVAKTGKKRAAKQTAAAEDTQQLAGNSSAEQAAQRGQVSETFSASESMIRVADDVSQIATRIHGLDGTIDISGVLKDAVESLRLAQLHAREIVGFSPRNKVRAVPVQQVAQPVPDSDDGDSQGAAVEPRAFPGFQQ